MGKKYCDINVYDATQKRLKFLFEEFDNIMVAFSGGKDSGVCLNLAYDYAKEHNMLNKLSMYHLDYEAQYQATTDYVTDTFLNNFKEIKKYWICLPISAQCAVNMSQDSWIPWDKDERDIWAREMPDNEFIINEDNIWFEFKKGQWDYDFQDLFSKEIAKKKGKTAVIIGLRTDESLNRYRAISSKKNINKYKRQHWINIEPSDKNVCKCYIIYDWRVEDIWIANAKKSYNYNTLYDLYYYAGLKLNEMRVASPFNDSAIDTLKVYKVVEPTTWAKLVGRVNGVNFAGIYGGTTAMGWKNIKLPKGHTWQTYLKFLLNTLPEQTRKNYIEKFETSIKFWKERGGVLDETTIRELKDCGLEIEVGGKTNYKTDKKPVRFKEYPDDADVTDFKAVPSYKRMCICIMKNDHLCKYMGFSQTKKEKEQRKKTIEKYKNIVVGK
jgi:predicted phosphoadenosine phosphosulfate sulfurtransferase